MLGGWCDVKDFNELKKMRKHEEKKRKYYERKKKKEKEREGNE